MELIDAAMHGKTGAVQQLLNEGADAKFADYDLRTPLHLACAEGRLSVVKLLIAAGADVSAEDRWHTSALEEAEKNGHTPVVEYLTGNDKGK